MAGVSKLYPPKIGNTIPAFYVSHLSFKNRKEIVSTQELGTAVISVPFSLNQLVGWNEISGFSLKIRTIQTGDEIITLKTSEIKKAQQTGIVKFEWRSADYNLEVGDYVKMQLACIDKNDTVGYYSTVATSKFTEKPKIEIKELDYWVWKSSPLNFTGIYTQTEDLPEKEYEYIFNLYDYQQVLLDSSGWCLHETPNLFLNVSKWLSKTSSNENPDDSDAYNFGYEFDDNLLHYVEYGVRTINGLEIFTGLYPVAAAAKIIPEAIDLVKLVAANNREEGYINVEVIPKTENRARGLYILYRASDKDNFKHWYQMKKFILRDTLESYWQYKDFLVEQGITYQYAIAQYNKHNLTTQKIYSNKVYCDYEDIFTYDGERQLKVRYNPKVTSFKNDYLEQKIDTIGNQFPYFFRNGNTKYKEFPVSGLLSYLEDNAEEFLTDEELGLEKFPIQRDRTASERDLGRLHLRTTSYEDYSVHAEKIFKNFTLDWLGNGSPKIFKSSTEGVFVVRFMNSSLAPDDKLSRLVHTFTATAYEVANYDYLDLQKLQFIDLSEPQYKYYEKYTKYLSTFSSQNGIIKAGTKLFSDSDKIRQFDAHNVISLGNTEQTYPLFKITITDNLLKYLGEKNNLLLDIKTQRLTNLENFSNALNTIRIERDIGKEDIINLVHENNLNWDFDYIMAFLEMTTEEQTQLLEGLEEELMQDDLSNNDVLYPNKSRIQDSYETLIDKDPRLFFTADDINHYINQISLVRDILASGYINYELDLTGSYSNNFSFIKDIQTNVKSETKEEENGVIFSNGYFTEMNSNKIGPIQKFQFLLFSLKPEVTSGYFLIDGEKVDLDKETVSYMLYNDISVSDIILTPNVILQCNYYENIITYDQEENYDIETAKTIEGLDKIYNTDYVNSINLFEYLNTYYPRMLVLKSESHAINSEYDDIIDDIIDWKFYFDKLSSTQIDFNSVPPIGNDAINLGEGYN